MENTFGKWFGPLIDQTGLKKKAVAEEAGIDPVSLSRILGGAQGISKDTATNLARALNTLSGREIASTETAIRLAVGLEPENLSHGKPQNLADLFRILDDMGIDGVQFSNEDALSFASPEELQELLDSIRVAVEVTLNKQRRKLPNAPENHFSLRK